ncbi:MAG TPA: AMP-binding protein, partial [Chitinophagaceae bacterium]|nr:AMP-binding protein [Chitinophagaceae bacterium]
IVIGTPTAGRQHADLEKMMGLFINTLALRLAPGGTISFKEFLNDVTDRAVACFDNQDYPYELLIDDLKIIRDTSRNPLFDAFFLYHNFERFELAIPGLQMSYYEREYAISKFDITLEAMQAGEKISLKFEHSTELFKSSTIQRFIEYFKNIASEVSSNAGVRISDIDIMPEAERKLLLHDFNDTYLDYPRGASIASLFEEQAHNTPDAIAVISKDGQLSYAEVNNKADAIAAYLGDCRGELIGVMAERDINLLPCLIGVLKSGAGYVPIDPSYPEERVKYVIEDSGIKQLLTADIIKDLPAATPARLEIGPGAPAYMIYTSGSTGKPKGVTITHQNVINFIYGTRAAVPFNGGSRMLCITTISFDIFVLESLFPLLSGMTIVLATTADQKDPDALVQLINQQRVDFIQMTPSHVKLLLGSGQGTEALQNVKLLLIGGEALPGELVDELQEHYSGKIYNMYGPTETTVYSCVGEAHAGERVTIGKPIANTVIRVLDKYGKLA